jgi:hypothetical protein
LSTLNNLATLFTNSLLMTHLFHPQ